MLPRAAKGNVGKSCQVSRWKDMEGSTQDSEQENNGRGQASVPEPSLSVHAKAPPGAVKKKKTLHNNYQKLRSRSRSLFSWLYPFCNT